MFPALAQRAPTRDGCPPGAPCGLWPVPCGLFYNLLVIAFARAVMSVMIWLFFIGVAGSLLVILISFFEDLNELLGKE